MILLHQTYTAAARSVMAVPWHRAVELALDNYRLCYYVRMTRLDTVLKNRIAFCVLLPLLRGASKH
jgi:hypothetical protein